MTTIIHAGYVIADDQAIWGAGLTIAAAYDDMVASLAPHTRVVDEDDTASDEDTWQHPVFTYNDRMCMPATAALLRQVDSEGGNIAWGKRDGMLCTVDEEG